MHLLRNTHVRKLSLLQYRISNPTLLCHVKTRKRQSHSRHSNTLLPQSMQIKSRIQSCLTSVIEMKKINYLGSCIWNMETEYSFINSWEKKKHEKITVLIGLIRLYHLMCDVTRISNSDIPDKWFGYVINRYTFIYLIGRNIEMLKLEAYDKKTYVIIDVIQFPNYIFLL